MARVKFTDIFTGDYLAVMTGYRERIQYILESYEVAVFMACKAVCFYTAMKNNGEITDTDCHVMSSAGWWIMIFFSTSGETCDCHRRCDCKREVSGRSGVETAS